MECISYKKGYKYQLVEKYEVIIPFTPEPDLISISGYLSLSTTGLLCISKGYAWDGPSGPTIDTKNFMRGSLVHDALYQLMREGLLDHNTQRNAADKLLQQMCREDGMTWMRAKWVYVGLKLGGDPAADPKNKKPIIKAPR